MGKQKDYQVVEFYVRSHNLLHGIRLPFLRLRILLCRHDLHHLLILQNKRKSVNKNRNFIYFDISEIEN